MAGRMPMRTDRVPTEACGGGGGHTGQGKPTHDAILSPNPTKNAAQWWDQCARLAPLPRFHSADRPPPKPNPPNLRAHTPHHHRSSLHGRSIEGCKKPDKHHQPSASRSAWDRDALNSAMGANWKKRQPANLFWDHRVQDMTFRTSTDTLTGSMKAPLRSRKRLSAHFDFFPGWKHKADTGRGHIIQRHLLPPTSRHRCRKSGQNFVDPSRDGVGPARRYTSSLHTFGKLNLQRRRAIPSMVRYIFYIRQKCVGGIALTVTKPNHIALY